MAKSLQKMSIDELLEALTDTKDALSETENAIEIIEGNCGDADEYIEEAEGYRKTIARIKAEIKSKKGATR